MGMKRDAKAEALTRLRALPETLSEMVRRPQWVVWKYENRDGKPTKVPYEPEGEGFASTSNPKTWRSFEAALAAFEASDRWDGIGFVFAPEDPFCGVDLDNCLDGEGHPLPWAKKIIDALGTYTEVSPSGRGVKLFLEGKIPPGRRRKDSVEMYESGRYFTVTGCHLEGTPKRVEKRQPEIEALHSRIFAKSSGPSQSQSKGGVLHFEDQKLLEKARKAKNGKKFSSLFDSGDTSGYGGDDSSADAALCAMLAFWCEGDEARVDRLFRRSRLCRAKWDSARNDSTYGAQTIANATSLVSERSGKGEDRTDFEPAGKPTQAQQLEALTGDFQLFHSADSTGYASINLQGHLETWPLRSSQIRGLLSMRFYQVYEKPPGSQAKQDVLALLEARAQFDGPETPVHLRLAEHDGVVYLDLANSDWETVEISSEGWKVVSEVPVRFRRTPGMLALPRPESGGSLEKLARFINVPDRKHFILAISWLIGALRPSGPFAMLILQGEQGSAKSTTARVLRALVDPSVSPVRTTPSQERDLMIAARNAWLLSYDNLSGLQRWLSDSLCRLATGGGLATRTLFTDDEEHIFDAKRPVLLNGIAELGSEQDLADRAIIVTLPAVPPHERRTEKQIWKEFEAEQPFLLGALCTAVSCAIRNETSVRLTERPRMADFATWVVAAEPALPWSEGQFIAAYKRNREDAIELALEGDAVAVAVRKLMSTRSEWSGTATELLLALDGQVTEAVRKSRRWPKASNGLSERLRRAGTFLRSAGIDAQFVRQAGSGSRKVISIRRTQGRIDAIDASEADKTSVCVDCVDCVDPNPRSSSSSTARQDANTDEVIV